MAEVKINVYAKNRFLNRTVRPYLRKKAEEIVDEARRRAPVGATGELENSFMIFDGPNGGVQIRNTAAHAGYVHQGTGPQANPPRAAYYPKLRRRGLILWSESKGLDAGSVARGIAVKGTAPNPFLEEALQTVLARYNFRWIRRDLVVN